MLPKIIHYCWFGRNPLPPLALECIASWRKFFPDYEIKEWNEDNFDVNMMPYTREAYAQKKYAFVSDVARFWILYNHGGIYFDTDVEVIRPMDDILQKGNFMGFETDPDGENSPLKYAPRYAFSVNPGVGIGMEQQHSFCEKMLDFYKELHFTSASTNDPFLKNIVTYTTEMLMKEGLQGIKGIQQVGDITIYPSEYFAPINVITGRLHITPNTHTIHRYMGSWDSNKSSSLKQRIRNLLPEWVLLLANKIKRRKYKIHRVG